MKLFISNQQEFKEEFNDNNSYRKKSSDIHKAAFNVLFQHVSNNSIPITIIVECEEIESDKPNLSAIFDFEKVMNDIYFYKFSGIV